MKILRFILIDHGFFFIIFNNFINLAYAWFSRLNILYADIKNIHIFHKYKDMGIFNGSNSIQKQKEFLLLLSWSCCIHYSNIWIHNKFYNTSTSFLNQNTIFTVNTSFENCIKSKWVCTICLPQKKWKENKISFPFLGIFFEGTLCHSIALTTPPRSWSCIQLKTKPLTPSTVLLYWNSKFLYYNY